MESISLSYFCYHFWGVPCLPIWKVNVENHFIEKKLNWIYVIYFYMIMIFPNAWWWLMNQTVCIREETRCTNYSGIDWMGCGIFVGGRTGFFKLNNPKASGDTWCLHLCNYYMKWVENSSSCYSAVCSLGAIMLCVIFTVWVLRT